MLCSVCRRQLRRTDARCRACGTPLRGTHHLDLVLPSGERVPLERSLSLGRAPASDLRLEDPSVSRAHARIELAGEAATLTDAGSSYGTFVDGRRLHAPVALAPGMRIELGDLQLVVAERVDRAAAAYTVSVPAGMSLVVSTPAVSRTPLDGHAAQRPRLRSGWSLKRLDAAAAEDRYVLKDHASRSVMRLSEGDAELLRHLDGRHELVELIARASAEIGPEGPARLARLLAELADRGLLAGVTGSGAPAAAPRGWRRAFAPREHTIAWLPRAIARVYRRGGFLLFTRAARIGLGAVALAGLVAFAWLVAGRYGTPFVVARRVGLGALVFVLGRLLLVLCHETAHGLIAESYGRPVSRAGIKLAFVFPYAFVDTTDAWFEARGRRIAISLAGPASDLVLGGAFAIACLASPAGDVRDILFQVAFGGYVAALFNLNPLLERDGYHALVDVMHEPGLRRRATRRLADALSGHGAARARGADPLSGHRAVRERAQDDGRLLAYGLASLAWSVGMVAFVVVLSLRYYRRLVALAPPGVVWTLLAAFYIVLALPVAVQLLRPLWLRATAAPSGA